MNDQMNTPMSPMPSGPVPFYQVWMNAITKPSEQTFAEMTASPDAKSTTAFLWVFAAALVEFFFVALVQGALFRQILEQRAGDLPVRGLGLTLVTAICGAPVLALVIVVFFAIGTALIQWVARMFGGRGTFDQMAYAFAAISAPLALVSTIFALLGAIPYVGFCFRIVIWLFSLYVLVLQIMATKGIHQFGWGQAAGSVLAPGLTIFLVCCCLAVAAGALGGGVFQEVLRQLRQGTGQ